MIGLLRFAATASPVDLADRLLDCHGSVGAIFAALPLGIAPLVADAPNAVSLLEAARQVMLSSLKVELSVAPLVHPTVVIDYLRGAMAFARREMVRALFLDGHHRLILDDLVHRGSCRSSALPSLQIVRTAVSLDASSVLLAHNHPSGNHQPSETDRIATAALAARLAAVGVTLQDHLIFSRSGWASFRALGLLSREAQPF